MVFLVANEAKSSIRYLCITTRQRALRGSGSDAIELPWCS